MARDRLARFSYSSKDLTDTSAKPRLFRPDKYGKMSVHYTDDLSFEDQVELGKDVGQSRADRSRKTETLYGWAVLLVVKMIELDLILMPDNSHVNIINWPRDNVRLRYVKQKLAQSSLPVKISPIEIHPICNECNDDQVCEPDDSQYAAT